MWQEEQEAAFKDLKKALVEYPILRIPDSNREYELYTDCSGVGAGAVLSQRDDSNNGVRGSVCV